MSIARKSLVDYFAQNAGLVISFVAGILISVVFGREGRGEYALVLTANLILINMTNMGIEVSARVFAGKDPDDVARIHTAGVVLVLGVSLLVGVGLLFSGHWLHGLFFQEVPQNLLNLAALLLPFSLYQLVWQGVMVGLGEIGWHARMFMWNRIIQSGAVILLLSLTSSPSVGWLLYLWVIIQVATVIVSIVVMARKYRLFAPVNLPLLGQMLRFSWLVYFGNFASSLMQKYDMMMISHFTGNAGVGLYNQASTFSEKVMLISGSLERATYAPATSAGPDYAPVLIQKVFRYNLYVNIAGAAAMYVFGSLVICNLLPEEFLGSLFPLKFLLLSVVFMSCSRILAIYFTAHLKKPQIPGVINWFLLPIGLALIYFLSKNFGVRGASVGVALVYLIHSASFMLLFVLRNRRLPFGEYFIPTADDARYFKAKILSRLRRPRGAGKKDSAS